MPRIAVDSCATSVRPQSTPTDLAREPERVAVRLIVLEVQRRLALDLHAEVLGHARVLLANVLLELVELGPDLAEARRVVLGLDDLRSQRPPSQRGLT